MISTFNELGKKIKDKSVLIVGGGPDANRLSANQYEEFDIIVRINNFKYANECKRTDYWFSYFGNNIKKIEDRINNEDIRGLICKCPINGKWGWINTLRTELWGKLVNLVYIPTKLESFQTHNFLDISPTSGIACIFNILAGNPSHLSIIGFDFFKSQVHNFNDKWDNSGGHNPEIEQEQIGFLVEAKILTHIKEQ